MLAVCGGPGIWRLWVEPLDEDDLNDLIAFLADCGATEIPKDLTASFVLDRLVLIVPESTFSPSRTHL